MSKFTKIIEILCIIIVAGAVIFLVLHYRKAPEATEQPIATALYSCNGNKIITAEYYQGDSPKAVEGQPPVPTGSVKLAFGDKNMTLAQTISADGARYANTDESFVFWSKGNGAMVLEIGEEKNYKGCIIVSDDYALPQIYSNGARGFSIRLPGAFAVDESYKYTELGPAKNISGVKFTIPLDMATGTNLGSDSYISVEQIPQSILLNKECAASFFVDPETPVSKFTDNGTDYSVASSTGAGAGNRYEEMVYALPWSNPCTAIRYFIHTSVFSNYPAGTVKEFNPQNLVSTFDILRRTLILAQ